METDLSYATIASLLPFDLTEKKPGLNPSEYIIKKAEDGNIGLTIIPNNAFYNINPDILSDEIQHIPVPVRAIELAQSIITDYVTSLLGIEPPEIAPGLFAVRGNFDDNKQFKIRFNKEITIYRDSQNRWFSNLVAIADDGWSKTHSPLSISDIQRFACRALGLQRPWLDPLPIETVPQCPMCKNTVNVGAVKCIACGFVLNKTEFDRLMAAVK